MIISGLIVVLLILFVGFSAFDNPYALETPKERDEAVAKLGKFCFFLICAVFVVGVLISAIFGGPQPSEIVLVPGP